MSRPLTIFTADDIMALNPCYDPIEAGHIDANWSGTLVDILNNNKVKPHNRIWCISKLADDKTNRLFAVKCARKALSLTNNPDPRSVKAIDVAEQFALGNATVSELSAARSAAHAAWSAARSAVESAAGSAAEAAAAEAAAAESAYAAESAAEAAARSAAAAAAAAAEAAARSAAAAAESAAGSAAAAAAAARSTAVAAAAEAARAAYAAAAGSAAESVAWYEQLEFYRELIQPTKIEISGQALKYDTGKQPMSLLPFVSLFAIAEVLAFGAKKYGPDNWKGGFAWRRVSDAALRHIGAWVDGEDNDPESGLSHLAHAGCCILFLLYFIIKGVGTDDRYKQRDLNNEPDGLLREDDYPGQCEV